MPTPNPARRPSRYAKSTEHICARCILPGDKLEITGPASVLLIETVEPYTHENIVPEGEIWAIAEQANGHGITLEWHVFCPFDAMPGSILPCGCHLMTDGNAVLCPPHEDECQATFTGSTVAEVAQ